MTLPKEYRKGFFAQIASAASEFLVDSKKIFTSPYGSLSRWTYGAFLDSLETSVDSDYSDQCQKIDPEVRMSGILTQQEHDEWNEKIEARKWDQYMAELKREVPMEALAREIDLADVVQFDKGYTETQLDEAITTHELLEQFNGAVNELVGSLEDDSFYHIKALGIASKMDTMSVDSVEDAFLELTDLKDEYQAEKKAAMISYTDVLERADRLQAVMDSGLVGKGLQVRLKYGKTMRSVYQGIDEALGNADGQAILADQVTELDALEAKLNVAASKKIEAVAHRASSAYARAVVGADNDVSDQLKQELYNGAKGLTEFAVDIKYDGLDDRDLGIYAKTINSLELLADKVMDDSVKVSEYIPASTEIVQPRL